VKKIHQAVCLSTTLEACLSTTQYGILKSLTINTYKLSHLTTVNSVQFTFVLVKWRQNTVVLAHFKVHLLLDSVRNCSGRYDDGDSCTNCCMNKQRDRQIDVYQNAATMAEMIQCNYNAHTEKPNVSVTQYNNLAITINTDMKNINQKH